MGELKQKQLFVHEWLAIASVAGLLAGIGLICCRYNQCAYECNEPSITSDSIPPQLTSQETITVRIRGAVKQEQQVTLPRGARMEDLAERLLFDDDADVAFLRKKRELRNHEQIIVPRCK